MSNDRSGNAKNEDKKMATAVIIELLLSFFIYLLITKSSDILTEPMVPPKDYS